MRVSKLEIAYIKFIYFGIEDKNLISEKLRIPIEKFNSIEESIFKKYKTKSWFQIIRITFDKGLIKRCDYSSFNIENEASKLAKQIFEDENFAEQSHLEIKLRLFYKLINLYNKFESEYLLKRFDEIPEVKY